MESYHQNNDSNENSLLRRWMAEADADQQQGGPSATLPYPWRRYFARSVDLSIYALIWAAVYQLIFRWPQQPDARLFFSLLDTYVTLGLMLLFEPLMLSFWGTTPGKWIFGLVIRNQDGSKLRYSQAWERTLGVFSKGMGYGIPIYNIVREVKSYKACSAEELLEWEEDLTYSLKDKHPLRIIGFICVTAIGIMLSLFIGMEARMPLHRGELTPKEYYENCNDTMKRFGLDYGRHLNETGKWVEDPFNGTVYGFSKNLPTHKLTVTDGIVSGVCIEFENDDDAVFGIDNQDTIAALSFLAAQDEMNGIRLQSSKLLQKLQPKYQDYSFTEAGIKVTNEVEFTGFKIVDGRYLFPLEGETQYFHRAFTLEKVGS